MEMNTSNINEKGLRKEHGVYKGNNDSNELSMLD